jgi:flagellum-specific ATP synthase
MIDVTDERHQRLAQRMRFMLATYRDAEDLINIGAYVQGSNPDIDVAVRLMPGLRAFLQQGLFETTPYEQITALMAKAVGG